MKKVSAILLASFMTSALGVTSITQPIMAKSGSELNGTITLKEEGGNVYISGDIRGVKPNHKFGFHIHEKPDCSSEDGKSAGGHYNPTNEKHGNPGDKNHHLGDLGNLKSNKDGKISIHKMVKASSLDKDAKRSILNRSIVLHAGADDFESQPSGDSGKRIGCVVLTTAANKAI